MAFTEITPIHGRTKKKKREKPEVVVCGIFFLNFGLTDPFRQRGS